MDAKTISEEISDKVGKVVKATISATNKNEKLDLLQIIMDARRDQTKLNYDLLFDIIKSSDSDCMNLAKIEEFHKTVLESLDESYKTIKNEIAKTLL